LEARGRLWHGSVVSQGVSVAHVGGVGGVGGGGGERPAGAALELQGSLDDVVEVERLAQLPRAHRLLLASEAPDVGQEVLAEHEILGEAVIVVDVAAVAATATGRAFAVTVEVESGVAPVVVVAGRRRRGRTALRRGVVVYYRQHPGLQLGGTSGVLPLERRLALQALDEPFARVAHCGDAPARVVAGIAEGDGSAPVGDPKIEGVRFGVWGL